MKSKSPFTVTILALVSLLTAHLYSTASAPSSETELTPSDFFGFRHFGSAVAIDGDIVVVGVPLDPEAGSNAGAAFVFVRNGATWSQQAKLTAADAAGGSEFGSSVAISGNTIVVGAPFAPAGSVSVGAAYAFVRSGSTWTQQSKLSPPDPIGNDQFGASVAIEGDTVAVGAVGAGQFYYYEGAVYVYARSGGAWTQQARLSSIQPGPGNEFGFSVALNNGTLAVGSPYDDDLLIADAGAVYVFSGSGATWNLQAELTASDAASDDRLGWSVALNGDTLVTGAPQNHSAAEFAGAAYVFVRDGAVWNQQTKLAADDSAMFDCFGYSVAVNNNFAVIGSVLDGSFAPNGGSAYLFTRAGSVWTQDSEFSASNISMDNHFGYSVSINGTTILAGAPSGYFFEEGAVYIFESSSSNAAPVANPQSIPVNEDMPVTITLSGSDAEGSPLTFAVLSGPGKGTLTGAPPNLTYTPDVNANGSDSFTFKVNDGELDSAPATVAINITAVNDGPAISGISDVTIAENSTTDPIAFNVGDADNDPATLTVSGSSDKPALVGNISFGGSGANRTVTITPVAGQFGTATITVAISDGAATASTQFVLTVTRVNRTPVADASATPSEVISPNNMNASVTLAGSRSSDPDGDALTFLWYADNNLSTPIGAGVSSTVTLSIGTHNITLVVNDGNANAADTVMVTVLSASQEIDRLINEVEKLDLPPGQKKDLIPGLQRAQRDIARGDYSAAINELVAVKNKIADWSGKRVASETAQVLIREIQQIIDALPVSPGSTKSPKAPRK